MTNQSDTIIKVYNQLFEYYGPRNWWPGDGAIEIMIGAVLTQAVAWRNVERAIDNLKAEDLISVEAILDIDEARLAELIRSALYHRQKARKLKALMQFLQDRYQGSPDLMFQSNLEDLRGDLLDVWGIGPETADSILLYAGNYPIFVIDAYTLRIFSRLGLVKHGIKYHDMQHIMHQNLGKDVYLYNEYHALIVNAGKDFCLNKKPRCPHCPIRDLCQCTIF